jgi:hypothetical protein
LIRSLGKVTVKTEAKADTRDLFCVNLSATGLSNKEGFFAKSDPFLIVSRCNEDGSYSKVWQSPVVMDCLTPKWGPMKLSLATLCNGDIHRPIKIEIFDHEKSGKHEFMGQVTDVSIHQLCEARNNRLNVIEPEKMKKGKGYANSGLLSADDCKIEKHYSFTQYIDGKRECNSWFFVFIPPFSCLLGFSRCSSPFYLRLVLLLLPL